MWMQTVRLPRISSFLTMTHEDISSIGRLLTTSFLSSMSNWRTILADQFGQDQTSHGTASTRYSWHHAG